MQTPKSKVSVKNEGFIQSTAILKKELLSRADVAKEEIRNNAIDLSISDVAKEKNTEDFKEEELLESKSKKSIAY